MMCNTTSHRGGRIPTSAADDVAYAGHVGGQLSDVK